MGYGFIYFPIPSDTTITIPYRLETNQKITDRLLGTSVILIGQSTTHCGTVTAVNPGSKTMERQRYTIPCPAESITSVLLEDGTVAEGEDQIVMNIAEVLVFGIYMVPGKYLCCRMNNNTIKYLLVPFRFFSTCTLTWTDDKLITHCCCQLCKPAPKNNCRVLLGVIMFSRRPSKNSRADPYSIFVITQPKAKIIFQPLPPPVLGTTIRCVIASDVADIYSLNLPL